MAKFQFSLREWLVLMTILGMVVLVFLQRSLVNQIANLESRLDRNSSELRKRCRFISLIGSLDLKNEDDRKTMEMARFFVAHLSQPQKNREDEFPNFDVLAKDSKLIDIDSEKGSLEVLLLTTKMRESPEWDQTIVGLFESDSCVSVLNIHTTEKWHDVRIADTNNDGVDDIVVEEYNPLEGDSQISKNSVYLISRSGFDLVTKNKINSDKHSSNLP